MKTGKRNQIRQFIEAVQWATPSNISYLLEGRYDSSLYRKYEKELIEMTQTRYVTPLKKIENNDGRRAFTYMRTRKDIGTQHFNHDTKLRNCIARFFYDNGMKKASFKGTADVTIGNLFFEFDNGHMNNDQLEEKLRTHYLGKGSYRVVFFMSHRYNEDLEKERLVKLFEIVREVMYKKPNRILGTCYTQYLLDGKIYNLKGEKVYVSSTISITS
jgi:hypothetical protein